MADIISFDHWYKFTVGRDRKTLQIPQIGEKNRCFQLFSAGCTSQRSLFGGRFINTSWIQNFIDLVSISIYKILHNMAVFGLRYYNMASLVFIILCVCVCVFPIFYPNI